MASTRDTIAEQGIQVDVDYWRDLDEEELFAAVCNYSISKAHDLACEFDALPECITKGTVFESEDAQYDYAYEYYHWLIFNEDVYEPTVNVGLDQQRQLMTHVRRDEERLPLYSDEQELALFMLAVINDDEGKMSHPAHPFWNETQAGYLQWVKN